MDSASFIFPAVRGIQAGREYFTSMVPLEIIPRIFQFTDEELPPEVRSQRVLNRARIPEIRDYILNNPDSYVFSALTVSVNGQLDFDPCNADEPNIGHIRIAMNAQFLINDGQHRQAAIAEAIKKNPLLKNEHISVVFYRDEGLSRSQQIFSDLNRYAIRPTKSINILFNSREESSIIARSVMENVPVFIGLTEKERTAISNRSKALFTLSAICTATDALLHGMDLNLVEKQELAIAFWTQISMHMPQWQAVQCGNMKSSDVRKHYISSFSITLVALGSGGNAILQHFPSSWPEHLAALDAIDWSKDNAVWENLVFVNGRVAANRATQAAMSDYIRNLMMIETGDPNA